MNEPHGDDKLAQWSPDWTDAPEGVRNFVQGLSELSSEQYFRMVDGPGRDPEDYRER